MCGGLFRADDLAFLKINIILYNTCLSRVGHAAEHIPLDETCANEA
jgi:hypothetical protein